MQCSRDNTSSGPNASKSHLTMQILAPLGAVHSRATNYSVIMFTIAEQLGHGVVQRDSRIPILDEFRDNSKR